MAGMKTRIAHRLLARWFTAMEHATEKAKATYLKDHPNADPADHTVKEKGTGAKKPKAEPVKTDVADTAARDSEKRGAEMVAAKKDVDALAKKLEGKGGAKFQKQFDKAYGDVHEKGEKAAEAAEKLLKEYGDTIGQGTKGEEKAQRQATMTMLERTLGQWKANEVDHFKPKDTQGKVRQAEQTFGYAAELETYVRHVSKALKGEHKVDDSWAR